jgi:hypothetical protein
MGNLNVGHGRDRDFVVVWRFKDDYCGNEVAVRCPCIGLEWLRDERLERLSLLSIVRFEADFSA